jgi:hypothetical protein
VTAELQYPVPESVFAIPGVSNLVVFTYVDYAEAFTLEKASADIVRESSSLGSQGLGLRFTYDKSLLGELTFAEGRQRIDPIDPRGSTAFERAFGFLNDQTRVLFSLTQSY